jgi:hypothetical protein
VAISVVNTIKVRRGANASLPTLNQGELGFSTDTKQIYIGDGTANYEIARIAALGSMATQAANSVAITGGAISGITDLAVADGGTGASDAATARTNLGAKYDNISATDKLLGRVTTGAGVIEEIACTSAGRAILDDTDAAAQRVTLGLSTAIPSNPTSGNKKVTNIFFNVATGEIQYEVEP